MESSLESLVPDTQKRESIEEDPEPKRNRLDTEDDSIMDSAYQRDEVNLNDNNSEQNWCENVPETIQNISESGSENNESRITSKEINSEETIEKSRRL